MKSLKWQIEGAVWGTAVAGLICGITFGVSSSEIVSPEMSSKIMLLGVGFAIGAVTLSWLTVLDHFLGKDS